MSEDVVESKPRSRRAWRILIAAAVMAALFAGGWTCMISMPGRSWSGPLQPLSGEEQAVAGSLRRDVEMLAGTLGNRNLYAPTKFAQAADYIEARFKEAGLAPVREVFDTRMGKVSNIEAEIRGDRQPGEIVLIGAHYDSVF